VNGIVPGYGGHVPGARDNYGMAHVGGLSVDNWRGQHAGPQSRHEKTGDIDAQDSVNIRYKQSVNGILPGYTGFRAGQKHEYGHSAFGGVPLVASPDELADPAMLGQGGRAKPKEAGPDSFRTQVSGVLPGYTGFVPDKYSKFGESHYGGVALKANGSPQSKYENVRAKGDKELQVTARVRPGYSGHVPGARDSFGTATNTLYDFQANGMGMPE